MIRTNSSSPLEKFMKYLEDIPYTYKSIKSCRLNPAVTLDYHQQKLLSKPSKIAIPTQNLSSAGQIKLIMKIFSISGGSSDENFNTILVNYKVCQLRQGIDNVEKWIEGIKNVNRIKNFSIGYLTQPLKQSNNSKKLTRFVNRKKK
jgi:hypothetical protein